jgi:hypothetical protein
MPPQENVYKRQLYQGMSPRIIFGGKRPRYGLSSFYAMKNVCSDCAAQIDSENQKMGGKLLSTLCILGIIAVVLFIVLTQINRI